MPSADLAHTAVADATRLRTLRDLGLLDAPRSPAYDGLVRLAARLLHAPVALISLVDANRQFFLSEQGLAEPWASRRGTPLSHSFCKHVVADRAPFVVADAREHPRVAANLAIAELGVIAYAGIPLFSAEGAVLGALCAIDKQPRNWATEDLATLSDLAGAVMSEIALRQQQIAAQASERRRKAVLVREQNARVEAARAAERTARLYALTATLTQAVTPQQVAEAVTAQSMAALGAYAGMLLTRSADGNTLHLSHAIGHPAEVLATWATVPIDAPVSPAEAARTGEAIWLPSRAALLRAYPALPLAPNSLTEAAATIPLCINGEVVAVMMLSFATPQPFAEGDRTLLLFLAEQCAQALDRAQALGRAREELIERQRAEAALHAQTELYERLLQAQSDLGEAVAMLEGERVVFVNDAVSTLTGYSREALLALPSFRGLLAPEVPAFDAAQLPRAAGTPSDRFHEELTLIHATGRRVEVELAAIGLRTDGASRWIVLLRDITARKLAEAERHALDRQLRETQKLESLGLLAGGIAHDFNNMLVSILGNADLALNDLEPAHPARPSVEQLMVASRRAADLTNQLLAYSGRGRFVVGPLDLYGLVQEMAGLLRAAISRTITLETELEQGLPLIEADATQLRQVVMNLVINAAEAIRGGDGRIRVRVGQQLLDQAYLASCYLGADLPPGPYVAVEVADTGTGMDALTLQRIFEPFFSTKRPGRGLGLAAVLGIVRAHGGTLHIRSAPGHGTTMTALLPPSARQDAPPPREHTRATPATARTTVLVIDDEESVRNVTRRMLERLGYGVCNAASGEEGLALCAVQAALGGVLLDLTMPGLSGEQTFLRLRAAYPQLPVVIMSGYSEQEVRSRLGSAAGVGVVQKPFSAAHLQQALAAVIPPAVPAAPLRID